MMKQVQYASPWQWDCTGIGFGKIRSGIWVCFLVLISAHFPLQPPEIKFDGHRELSMSLQYLHKTLREEGAVRDDDNDRKDFAKPDVSEAFQLELGRSKLFLTRCF